METALMGYVGIIYCIAVVYVPVKGSEGSRHALNCAMFLQPPGLGQQGPLEFWCEALSR